LTRDRFDIFDETKADSDYDAYDDAKDRRNKFYWYVAGTIFIGMWDAYADAHLKPFEEVKDDDEFWGLFEEVKDDDEFWGLNDDHPDLSPPPLSLALTFRF